MPETRGLFQSWYHCASNRSTFELIWWYYRPHTIVLNSFCFTNTSPVLYLETETDRYNILLYWYRLIGKHRLIWKASNNNQLCLKLYVLDLLGRGVSTPQVFIDPHWFSQKSQNYIADPRPLVFPQIEYWKLWGFNSVQNMCEETVYGMDCATIVASLLRVRMGHFDQTGPTRTTARK